MSQQDARERAMPSTEAINSAYDSGHRDGLKSGITIGRNRQKREDEQHIAALRVGAQEMVAMQEALYGPCEPECECSTAQLKAVLDGIPFGPPQERALRVAAQQVVDDYLAGVPMLRVSITELRRALAGQAEEVVS